MISLRAPAKLNLFLLVTGRREDGYHDLQTLFQFVGLFDLIDLEISDDNEIHLQQSPFLIEDDLHLCVRAARLLRERSGVEKGCWIRLQKKIPVGAGLGGGSSDAAAVLLGLNQLWQLGLSATQLASIGLELGADVPVFVHGRSALATGIGEQLDWQEPEQAWFVVIYPRVAVSTVDIFRAQELTRDSAPIKMCAFLAGDLRNDCETAVVNRYPQVAEALSWLAAHGKARLTGTGSSVFLKCENRQLATELAAGVPDKWDGFCLKGMNRSPLHDGLAQ